MRCDLSIVATSRNDDHGGNLLHRMQLFVNGLLEQCRRHQLDAELILVDWNPPPDKPKLKDALSYPVKNGRCDVRIIEVPSEIHQRFKHSDQLPLFQMIAKNVGIRRARAPFVLATNIDILFSEELMAFLALRQLEDRFMYRLDRYDVPAELPTEMPVPQLLDFCRNNVTRVYTRWGSRDARTGKYDEGSVTWKTIIHDLLVVLSGDVGEKRLHTNASGDFTLLSKANWFKIRGYPELHTLAMHIDGLGCQIAYFSGVRQRILANPRQIYHIEHSTGTGWTPEGDGALMARINSAGIPKLDYERFKELAIRMHKERRPIIMNDEGWGLANEQLHETIEPK